MFLSFRPILHIIPGRLRYVPSMHDYLYRRRRILVIRKISRLIRSHSFDFRPRSPFPCINDRRRGGRGGVGVETAPAGGDYRGVCWNTVPEQ